MGITSDDATAEKAELAASLGFPPVAAGGLRPARVVVELALLDITLDATNGCARRSPFQLIGPTA
ncbi:hypothetical protein [Blastococcus mobilis]|uniref:Uncharacterized protein n=1 Tax=Blastococcus mobilis TaxID=1938746 RepID=A0A238Y8P7_9ACTN|nr:hypothetical protein [Blastococcus mobilis]SNR67666.1 hypothetical protein SAMN06272737_118101 [Blastococcus mobilis]